MDGRPLRKVADYLLTSFGVRYVDTVTTAGLVKHLADETEQTANLLANLEISIEKHSSRHVAVVAHHDCAGNPISDAAQKRQVAEAVTRLRQRHPDIEVIGLWLGEHWIIERIRPT